jgi:hypothetical protein
MALIDLWNRSKIQLEEKHVQQVIAIAGDGKLVDDGKASAEFRTFLQQIPTSIITRYANECLDTSFTGSGLALQDIINEVGNRLGFSVSPGRYRGAQNQIGFDGLWQIPNKHAIVVEVKTTDAYRIDLDKIAAYRRALVSGGKITEDGSSILIVVGRDETGDLEAQIRGSRHAWDVRLISVDALQRLLALKEEVGDPIIIRKIHEILIPREFTRLDEIADILFSTAEDIKQVDVAGGADEGEKEPGEKKPKFTPVAFHDACIERIQKHINQVLLKRSRATFSSPDNSMAVICAVSKRHVGGGFWFAIHPHQKEFLEASAHGFVAFGCGSPEKVLLIPASDFTPWLSGMNVTQDKDRFYWHVYILEEGDNLILHRKKGEKKIDITGYLLPIKKRGT